MKTNQVSSNAKQLSIGTQIVSQLQRLGDLTFLEEDRRLYIFSILPSSALLAAADQWSIDRKQLEVLFFS